MMDIEQGYLWKVTLDYCDEGGDTRIKVYFCECYTEACVLHGAFIARYGECGMSADKVRV